MEGDIGMVFSFSFYFLDPSILLLFSGNANFSLGNVHYRRTLTLF